MAQPITLELPARDPRVELRARLENAPLEHAEALLSAYEVLQGLHDRGVFELLRGTLGNSDKVIQIIVEAAKTPESIRGIRNGLILARTLGNLDPEVVEAFARSLAEAVAFARAHQSEPPGFWAFATHFRKKSVRRGLLLVNSLLDALGRNLSAEKKNNHGHG